eukprot:c24365_g4_i1 orf=206-463(-)
MFSLSPKRPHIQSSYICSKLKEGLFSYMHSSYVTCIMPPCQEGPSLVNWLNTKLSFNTHPPNARQKHFSQPIKVRAIPHTSWFCM